jgi:ABC-type polysaccharide/polyol phosphate export permease
MTISILTQRSLIWTLARRELRVRFAGSLLGTLWSFINPLVFLGIYYIVFSVIFKTKDPNGIPFIVVFLCAFVPWTLFSDALIMGTSSILGSAQIVSRMAFPIELLPVAQLLVAGLVHVFMLALLFIVLMASGIAPTAFAWQLGYFELGLMLFTLGLIWLTSSLNVFFRDIGQLVNTVLAILFWLSPIVYVQEQVPTWLRWPISLNPLSYVINGFRDSLLYGRPIWHDLWGMTYFWTFTAGAYIFGAYVFLRLKDEFADAL